jgi:hypothetical protein
MSAANGSRADNGIEVEGLIRDCDMDADRAARRRERALS